MSAPAASPAVGATPPPTVNSTAPPPATPAAPPPAQPPPSAPPPAPPASPPPAAPAPTSPSPPSGAIPTPPTPPASQAPPLPPAAANPPPPSANNPSPPSANNPSPPSAVPATPTPPSTPAGRSPPAAPRTPSGGNNPPSSSSSSGGGGGLPSGAIIGIAVGGVLVALILGLVVCCLRRRKPKKKYGRDDYGSGQYKADSYEAGRRPPYGGQGHLPPPPPPPPPHAKHYAYGSPGPAPPPPPPPPHYSSSGSQGSWKPVPPPPPPHGLTPSMGNSRSWFTYDELEEATGGFARANMLGEGGFGCVYKGQLRGGQIVAVKQLKAGSGQGEREFRAEVEIISRVHHRHLVSLVGYCIADSQRLLVYDYVPNGTLEHHLHGRGRPVMDWPSRLRIATGAARGLAYLHEDCHPRIIHRDIKSSNILLDNNFEAQVSDFGLAKLASDTYTHITTRVMGTFGYLAPEYASTGKLTDKSDVYSFGVVLLEMISGRKPVDTTQVGDESLVEWARPLLTQALDDGNIQPLVDPRLVEYNGREMLRMIEAAAACVRHSASKRPRMAQVVRVLENDEGISDLNQGVKPGHSSNYGSADYGNSQYSADMRRFKKMAFGSQEYGSEYSAPTSEYGMNPSVSSSEALSSMEMEKRKNGTDTSSSEMHTNIASEGLNGR